MASRVDGPSVAVIIPCYNSSRFLKKTLDSALAQNYQPLEIITVNDGSSDDTGKILESYQPRIRVLYHPNGANRGESASVNLALSTTQAEFVAFLGHDDLWYPQKVERVVAAFEESPHAGLVYSNGHMIDETDRVLYPFQRADYVHDPRPHRLLLDCYIKTPSLVVVRRSVLALTGQFSAFVASDHDLWLRIAEVSSVLYVPDCLVAHRKHGKQQSIVSRRQMWQEGFEILDRACRRYPYGIDVKRKRKAVLHYRLFECDWAERSRARAVLHFLCAALLDPLRALSAGYGLMQRHGK